MILALDLQWAFSRVRGISINTPLIGDTFLNDLWDCEVYLKCEQKQPIGAFKIRGAANFALQLSKEERERGFITHSSGNHAQAVAFMAHQMNVKAYVVMPNNSNQQKIKNAEKWRAEIILCEPTIDSRIETANAIAQKNGSMIIPPFDHEWIVAGQATAAMEIIAEQDNIDYIITPLGGGGLLAGSTLAAHYFSPSTKVIGAEPKEASDGYEGFKSGKRETSVAANTVADGLRTTVGEVPFEIIKRYTDDVWLAKEDQIIPWMYRIWNETKMIIEPSCAVPFVAMDAQKEKLKGKKVAVIITGGNVDLNDLP